MHNHYYINIQLQGGQIISEHCDGDGSNHNLDVSYMLTCMYTAAKNMARSSGAYGCSQTD